MKITFLTTLILAISSLVSAEIETPAFFSDQMVLQQETEAKIWGTTGANQGIKVTFAGQTQTAKADQKGSWLVAFKGLKASQKGASLTIESGQEKKIINDFLVGEVWLASGQSNMEWTVAQSSSASSDPKDKMRLTPVPNRDGLAESDETMADALKAAGYATGHFGNCHVYQKGGKGGGGALPSKLHLYHEEWLLDGGKEAIETNHLVELYDLENDIGVQKNLAQQKPEVSDKLLDELVSRFEAAEAPMPKNRYSAKSHNYPIYFLHSTNRATAVVLFPVN